MSPKIVDKEAKRKHILKTAITSFAQRGYQTTNMNDIAKAAGIGKGTIYEYFQSKDQIFKAAYDYFFEQFHYVILKSLHNVNNPMEKLSVYLDSYRDFIKKEALHISGIILDFWASGIRPENESKSISLKSKYHDSQTTLELILFECIRAKQIKPIDTKSLSSIILATLDGLTIQWLLQPDHFELTESIALFKQILFKGLRKQ